jgi:hypothetical protein
MVVTEEPEVATKAEPLHQSAVATNSILVPAIVTSVIVILKQLTPTIIPVKPLLTSTSVVPVVQTTGKSCKQLDTTSISITNYQHYLVTSAKLDHA